MVKKFAFLILALTFFLFFVSEGQVVWAQDCPTDLRIFASSVLNDDFKAEFVTDRDPTTAWSSGFYGGEDPGEVEEWLVIDFGEPKTIDRFVLTARVWYNSQTSTWETQAFPVDFHFKYSDDGVGWGEDQVLLEYTDYPTPLAFQEGTAPQKWFVLEAPVTHRYFLLGITRLATDSYGGYYAQLAGFKVIGPAAASPFVTNISFAKKDYMSRHDWNCCDSWMMSWGDDGRTYASCSDGAWEDDGVYGCSWCNDRFYSNFVYRIEADPPNILPEHFYNVSQNPLGIDLLFEEYSGPNLCYDGCQRPRADPENPWPHYIINTLVVDEVMYFGLTSSGDKRRAGIGRSTDYGQTIDYHEGLPMWDSSQQRFISPCFLQNGQGYAGNEDDYVYLYGSDGDWGASNTLRLARVAKAADLLNLNNYEYYSECRGWVDDINQATDVLVDGNNLGGMESVIYNPVLNRYFLITFAEPSFTPGGSNNPRMVLYDAPYPWGPWFRSGIITLDEALWDTERRECRADTIYNPSFNAKWIEDDGSMWIAYSDGQPYYTFYYGKITVETLRGDLNGDGDVDAQDIKTLLENWGSSLSLSAADLNGDGKVNGVDFGQLKKLVQ